MSIHQKPPTNAFVPLDLVIPLRVKPGDERNVPGRPRTPLSACPECLRPNHTAKPRGAP